MEVGQLLTWLHGTELNRETISIAPQIWANNRDLTRLSRFAKFIASAPPPAQVTLSEARETQFIAHSSSPRLCLSTYQRPGKIGSDTGALISEVDKC